jgi:hypothetical protein
MLAWLATAAMVLSFVDSFGRRAETMRGGNECDDGDEAVGACLE